MSTWKRIQRTEAFQYGASMHDAYWSNQSFDGHCEDLTPRQFVDGILARRMKIRPSVHQRINRGWTARYWLTEVIKDDCIPF
jgi:hypothetical protein